MYKINKFLFKREYKTKYKISNKVMKDTFIICFDNPPLHPP